MYDGLSHFAQTWGLVLFVLGFLMILAYALSPANKQKFERASRAPLEEDEDRVQP